MALVTPESVGEAAKALRESGERVSVRGIRFYLGGGSPNQILTILRKLDDASVSQSDTEFVIPQALTSSIRKAMKEAGVIATQEAQQTIKDLEGTQSELIQEVRELDDTAAKQQIRISSLLSDLADREKDIARLESKNEQLLASKEDAINRLEAQRVEERKRGDALAAKLSDEQKKLAVADTKTQAAMERAEEADLRLSSVSFQLEGAFREMDRLRRQIEQQGE